MLHGPRLAPLKKDGGGIYRSVRSKSLAFIWPTVEVRGWSVAALLCGDLEIPMVGARVLHISGAKSYRLLRRRHH
jgi:hypothetical protein